MKSVLKTFSMKRFWRDTRGATAVVFSMSLVPVAGAVGMSVDFARANKTRGDLQAATDAAALAGAIAYKASPDATAAQLVASNTFAAAIGSKPATITQNAMNSVTGKMTFAVRASQTNYFLGILSPSNASSAITARAEVTSSAPATAGLGMNLEVSLMLDVTVSMAQNSGTPNLTKLAAMQQAANSLINTVVQTTQTPFKSRVALVPFSSAVNVGTRFRAINGSSPTGSWTSVVERAGAYAFAEDAPSAVSYFPSFRTKRSSALGSAGQYTRNLSSNVPGNAIVTPLSSSKTTLTNAINAYTTAGSTAGHLGTAFAWYTLSPAWSSIWGASNAPDPYDAETTLKVAVLMSDFDFNTYYQSGNGSSAAQTAALCTNMKAAGVVVYTIGFQVDTNDSTAYNLYRNCASAPENRIAAANGAQMIAAFNTIATTVLARASGESRLYVSK